MKKQLMTLALVAGLAAPAMATPFYVDNGFDFGGNSNAQADGATTTGWLDQINFTYESKTQFFGDGTFSTEAGWDQVFGPGTNLSANIFTGLNPTQIGLDPSTPSGNGFGNAIAGGTGWDLTFSTRDLVGTYTPTGPETFELAFTGGYIDFYYIDSADPSGFSNILTFEVLGSVPNPDGSELQTRLIATDESQVSFNTALGSFDESLLNPTQFVFANYGFDTGLDSVDACVPDVGAVACITGDHQGSVQFSVPEPASVALLGLGLLGLAGSRRRKA